MGTIPNFVLYGKSAAEMYFNLIGPFVWMGKLYWDFGTKSFGPKNWKSGFWSPFKSGFWTLSGFWGGLSTAPKIDARDGILSIFLVGLVGGFDSPLLLLFSFFFPFCSFVLSNARPKSWLSRLIFACEADKGFLGGVTEKTDFKDGTFVVDGALDGDFVVVAGLAVVGFLVVLQAKK